jgi:alanine racemase
MEKDGRVGGNMDFYRDTWIEVDLDAITHNVTNIKNHYAKDKLLFAVVKADAYGHGAIMVAKTALKAGADYLAVATLDEAIELRRHKIKAPILVLGYVNRSGLKLAAKYKITITVHNIKWLKKVVKFYRGKTIQVHLKVDTGMHRIGVLTKEELIESVALIRNSHSLHLNGIFTHLATAEEDDETYYHLQLNRFKELLQAIDIKDLIIHLANSAATVKFEHDFTNAVRVGLMMYGLMPKKEMSVAFDVLQAISLYGKLIHCKKLEPKKRVSYNGIYETKEHEWIGTLAIGYADGWDRRMENGQVYLNGELCPVVGRICMDQTMIKLPHLVEEGSLVELIGPHISVDEIAKRIRTINYQTVCQLSDRLPRIYKRKGKVVKVINRRLS